MAVTADASGTQSASVGTEHTLRDVATAGVYELEVDLVNLAAQDVVELRCYKIILTGGTRRVLFSKTYCGAQPADSQIKKSVPVSNELTDAGSLRFTLKQAFGTGRDFPWKVLKHA